MANKYTVQYSGTYDGGEQFSDSCGIEFSRKAEAIKSAKEMQADGSMLRGPEDQKIANIYCYVVDQKGNMVWG